MNKNKAVKELDVGEQRVIPVVHEVVKTGKKARETGVTRIKKKVHERVEEIDLPLNEEDVQVERITVNRFVEHPLPIRHERGVTIVPLLEEVLVVEKKLLLREELHISKAVRTVHKPQTITLRSEEVVIEHEDSKDSKKT